MNIQQLRYVVAIANSGTFREAAEKMYVSQPSLSIAVRDLEKELGFDIKKVQTDNGKEFTNSESDKKTLFEVKLEEKGIESRILPSDSAI